jgi:hypothetical protein
MHQNRETAGSPKCLHYGEILAEREGFEPDSDPQSDQQVTDPENDLVPADPPKTP